MSLFMGLVWQDTFLSVALIQIGLLQANSFFFFFFKAPLNEERKTGSYTECV